MQQVITDQVEVLIANIEKVLYGKTEAVKLCVTGLLARGHILIEDIPGIGKTTLAQGLARSIDCHFTRVQFTSDMLPADILGVSVLNPKTQEFEYRRGPIFANIVLADEVNRTPPKTQSALLEAMSEYTVSVDGRAHPLPRPFMVLATQNPIEYEGTYTLPEAQLDRFLIRIDIGYPDGHNELRIMRRRDPLEALEHLTPVLKAQDVVDMQRQVADIRVDDAVAEYMLAIIQATRADDHIQLGASPRGSLALFEACQARALVEQRDYVTPGDVKRMASPVLSHRVIVKSRGTNLVAAARERNRIINEIVKKIPIPR
jgi:MoxR-like ATPase